MDLDPIFEDIEAEAFFLELKKPKPVTEAANVVQIVPRSLELDCIYLFSPILADDYLAGFTSNPKRWTVIPLMQILKIQLPNLNSEIVKAKSNLAELCETSLFGKPLKFTFQGRTPSVLGRIMGRSGLVIQVLSNEGLLLLPVHAIAMIAVEKISEST